MAQGSGLSIDPSSSSSSHHHHHHQPLHLFFTSSLSSDHSQDHSLRHCHKLKLEPMDCRQGLNMFSSLPPPPPPPPPATIQFPLNLNCTTTDHDHDQDQEHDDEDRCFKSDEKRPVIDEMDFFASKKDDQDHNIAAETDDDQKEALCGPQHFNVNVSLVSFFFV